MSALIQRPQVDSVIKKLFYLILFLTSLLTLQIFYGTGSQFIIKSFTSKGINYAIDNYWQMTTYFIVLKSIIVFIYAGLLFLTLKQTNWKISSLGFDFNNFSKDIIFSLKTFFVFPILPFIAYFILTNIFLDISNFNFLKPKLDFNLKHSYSAFFLIIISSVFIFPILEELIFRGVLFKKLISFTRPITTILLSSLIFTFFHLNLFKLDSVSLLSVAPILFGGIMLGFLRWKTGNLWSSILYHIMWNGLIYSSYFWQI